LVNKLCDFVSVITTFGYVLLALVALLIMITIHEFGHYCMGKWLGFKINEFSIGFGKVIWQTKKKDGQLVSLRLVPLGGYCQFEGEDSTTVTTGAFNSQKPWKRLLVLFNGAFFNFLSAIIFSVVLLASFGYSDVVQITEIKQNLTSPTCNSEIQVGDIIEKVNGTKTDFFDDKYFKTLIADYKENENITLTIKRNGQDIDINVFKAKFGETDDTIGLGVTYKPYVYNFGEALLLSIPFTFKWGAKVLVTLFQLITFQLPFSSVGGPITTISFIADATQTNWANLLLLFPVISVNLAVFNWLPIPALDGARMVFVIIEWIRGKPIDREVEAKIHMVGLIVLFSLVILADLYHIITKGL
jgi:regulator of sigma E protease